jgi:tRNA dimethylallyltransferase
MSDASARAVLITGPTASGKSAAAVAMAEAVGGVVINADSMQVYRELAIVTARPAPEDEARVPHWLYGHVPGREAYSVGRWLADVATALREADAAGLVPIIVGGTGLYLRALTEGLSEIPSIPDAVRAEIRGLAGEHSPQALHDRLAACDPVTAARLSPTDAQRILRALEVQAATGRPLSQWQRSNGPALVPNPERRIVVELPRDVLAARIEARARAMLEGGGLEEVAAFLALGLDPELPAMRALGVAEFGAVLDGRATREQGLADLVASTRRYVKRQRTFFRNQMADWERIAG